MNAMLTDLGQRQEPATTRAPQPPRRSFGARIAAATGPATGAIAGIVILSIVLAITQPVFLTWGNIMNLVAGNSVILVLAIGSTFVLLSGGIDLSVVAASAATGLVFGLSLQAGHGALVAALLTLVTGLIFGAVNGALISYGRIPFLVVTLGTASVFASIALLANDGQTINTFEFPGFRFFSEFMLGQVAGVPLLLIFDVVLVVLAALVLKFTSFGRGIYAIGSNVEAARLNGIPVRRTTMLVYVIVGFSAAVASLISVGRLAGAAPTFDPTLLLTVLAAVLIGGTAYTGGEGGIGGTVLGVIFLGIIQNGLTLLNVSSFWRGAVNGTVLILAVALGVARERGWLNLGRGKGK